MAWRSREGAECIHDNILTYFGNLINIKIIHILSS